VTRVLAWANPYWPTVGGGPVLAERLLPALAERGHEITVLADRRPANLAAEERRHGVTIIRLPFQRALSGEPATFAAVRRRVRELKAALQPELIHLFTLGYAELFHHEAPSPGVPLLATLHRMFPNSAYEPEGIIGRTLHAADRITTCSRAILEETCLRVPEVHARATAALNALPEPAVDRLPLRFAPPQLLGVGVAEHRKGFDLALRAVAQLRNDHPTLKLTLVGDGSALAGLVAQASRLGIESAVTFLGRQDPPAVAQLMQHATLIVIPSRVEPFGLVALEAAQAGRPVVATRCGGLPEIVRDGETGILVAPGDPTAIATAVSQLLSNPQRAIAFGNSARLRARRHFGWQRFVATYDRLIRDLSTACPR
jgi:glycogen(starch) synthase